MKMNFLAIGRIGLSSGAGSGSGTLTFDTGTVEATTIRLADANFRQTSAVNIAETKGIINQNGGTLRFAELSKGTGTATFNWTAGTIGNLSGSDLNNQNVAISLNTAATHQFDVSAGQNATFQAGAGFTGAGGFTKTGLGTLTLNGANDHTGDTIVDSGTLVVGGSISASAVTVNAGTIAGGGSIANALTVGDGSGSADARIAPGLNGIGALGTGPLSLQSDAVFSLDINIAGASSVTSDTLSGRVRR